MAQENKEPIDNILYAAEDYVCDEHRTKEEREKELFEKAKWEYASCKRHIKALEEEYPSLKDLIKI